MPACCDSGIYQLFFAAVTMADPWRNYDRWKLQSPEREEDERERRRLRDERLMDKAEHDRERDKDERAERSRRE